jgi:hypothetical protein
MFLGPHQGDGLSRCGIALLRPDGLNDGSVKEHRYFSCAPKHGLLCAPAKVAVFGPAFEPVGAPISTRHVGWRVLCGNLGPGIVQFVGMMADGVPRVGVALEQKTGNGNGSFQGVPLFVCEDGYGVFCVPGDIRLLMGPGNSAALIAGQNGSAGPASPGASGAATPQEAQAPKRGSSVMSPGGVATLARGLAAAAAAAGPVTEKDLGARVEVVGYDCQGTLRFFGDVGERVACGVELDLPLGRNNGTVRGTSYFKCADGHGVLCDPVKVTRVVVVEEAPVEGAEVTVGGNLLSAFDDDQDGADADADDDPLNKSGRGDPEAWVMGDDDDIEPEDGDGGIGSSSGGVAAMAAAAAASGRDVVNDIDDDGFGFDSDEAKQRREIERKMTAELERLPENMRQVMRAQRANTPADG